MASTAEKPLTRGRATSVEEDEDRESSDEEAKLRRKSAASHRGVVLGAARPTWDNEAELFLACLGLSMGLGTFWRIPTLLRDNGGVAFLVPYLLLSLTVAKPVLFLELFLGQFSSQGSVGIWRCVPIGKGLGLYFLSFTEATGDKDYGHAFSVALFATLFLCMLNSNKFADVCHPKPIWGPDDPKVFSGYLDFLQQHDMKSPAQISPVFTAHQHMSLAGGMEASPGAGDGVINVSTKQAAASEDAAAAIRSESPPLREDVIRRMSVSLGRTPNQLRRMEVVLNRRRSTVSRFAQGKPSSEEPELKIPSKEKAAKLHKETPRDKDSPQSLPVELEIQPFPQDGDELPMMGNFGASCMPIKAMTSKTSYAQGEQGAPDVPFEFAGLEAQFTSETRPQIYPAPYTAVTPTGKPSVMPSAGLQQRTLPSQSIGCSLAYQPPAAVLPAGLAASPAAGPQAEYGGIASPLISTVSQGDRVVSKGHMAINAPTPLTVPEASSSITAFPPLQSTVQGAPMISYNELLCQPSVKLTLLEPTGSEGPEQAKQLQEQVQRAVRDFRRKSVAAVRTTSTAPPQFAGTFQPPGAGYGAVAATPVLSRQSMSGSSFQPGLLSQRKSIRARSFAPNTGAPGFSETAHSFSTKQEAPRRSISAASWYPKLSAARRSVSKGACLVNSSAPHDSNSAVNLAEPQRSNSTSSLLSNLSPTQRSIGVGSNPRGILNPRPSISAGNFSPRRPAPRPSISDHGFSPGIRRSIISGPDLRLLHSISGEYPEYTAMPRRSINGGPWDGPDATKNTRSGTSHSSNSLGRDRGVTPDSTGLKKRAIASTSEREYSDGDNEDGAENHDNGCGSPGDASPAYAHCVRSYSKFP
ncbi:hypothetical protein V5799_027614 [Amblyomma americanum]|uniref:Sodium-neurotransmitter symporter n=1 Tax=Amblyomma americanum TaxID=6943 RepID=A0AAQ4DF77_AMBAM